MILIMPLLPVFGQRESFQPGETVKELICSAHPDQSYALYLPPGYSPAQTAPILYALDPGANGLAALERFRAGAAELGFIIAASNRSHNGPTELAITAINAMWADTHERFRIDDSRVYITGFSGGARAASLIVSLKPGAFTGLILCGAGLVEGVSASALKGTTVIALVGSRDVNYLEMIDLHRVLESSKLDHRLIVFPGPHAWPPIETCQQAVRWLELKSQLERGSPSKSGFADEVAAQELAHGDSLERAGVLSLALLHYAEAQPLLTAAGKSGPIDLRIKALKMDKKTRAQLQREESLTARERRLIDQYRSVFQQIETGELSFPVTEKLASEIGIPNLLTNLGKLGNTPLAESSQRILDGITIDASFLWERHLTKKEYREALLYYSLGARTVAHDPRRRTRFLFVMACLQCALNDGKSAARSLQEAVKLGFDDWERLERYPLLESICSTPAYRQMADRIRNEQTDPEKKQAAPAIFPFLPAA